MNDWFVSALWVPQRLVFSFGSYLGAYGCIITLRNASSVDVQYSVNFDHGLIINNYFKIHDAG